MSQLKVVKSKCSCSDKPSCTCKSWMDHWRAQAGNASADSCVYKTGNCTSDVKGGHLADEAGKTHYVAPVCSNCNNSSDAVEVDASLLVSADTCKAS